MSTDMTTKISKALRHPVVAGIVVFLFSVIFLGLLKVGERGCISFELLLLLFALAGYGVYRVVSDAGAWYRGRGPVEIRTYRVATAMMSGEDGREIGQLQIRRGTVVTEKDEYERLGASGPILEYSGALVGPDNLDRSAVFFGPYSADCDDPGKYFVTFRIRAIGLPSSPCGTSDLPLLLIDVAAKWNEPYKGYERTIKDVEKRVLKASDLAKDDWGDYEIRFKSDGKGHEWEFRAYAFNGHEERADNIAKYGSSLRLLFDRVTVFRLAPTNA